jgi:DNA replication protein DnaC
VVEINVYIPPLPAEALGDLMVEIGRYQINRANLFFQLISRRYERGSIILTSNKPFEEWGAVFGDEVIATAVLDRLLHHSHLIAINGPSYRTKDKRPAKQGGA